MFIKSFKYVISKVNLSKQSNFPIDNEYAFLISFHILTIIKVHSLQILDDQRLELKAKNLFLCKYSPTR